MMVQVMMKDGTVKTVPVRYSQKTGRLFTTMAMANGRGFTDLARMEIASAPFDIYARPWNKSGWPEEDSYFSEANRIMAVPYCPQGWNYL